MKFPVAPGVSIRTLILLDLGSHWGIRLEDRINFQEGGDETTIWDIEPRSAGLYFGRPGQSDPLLLLDDNYAFEVNGPTTINGKVGVGTPAPASDSEFQMEINGDLRTKRVVVEQGWQDRVFDPSYELPTLEEEEKHIQEKGHLMGIPSEEKILEAGLNLGQLTELQQREIEEIYLHLFELYKSLDQKDKLIEELKEQNRSLRKQNELLKILMKKE